MSSQVDGAITIPSSFDFQREKPCTYRARSIESNGFGSWAADNMYKSSYAQFHSKDSTAPSSARIPGYQGFVPKNRAESLHGKGFTNVTKQIFGQSNYGKNQTGLASNGFNLSHDKLIDTSKEASTSKYGNSSWLKANPAWKDPQWKSTSQEFYVDPKSHGDPLFRNSKEEYKKPASMSSGYSTNRAYWDGTGWNPEKVLNPKNIASEYRNIYNPERPFHRDSKASKVRQMKKPEQVYKFNS